MGLTGFASVLSASSAKPETLVDKCDWTDTGTVYRRDVDTSTRAEWLQHGYRGADCRARTACDSRVAFRQNVDAIYLCRRVLLLTWAAIRTRTLPRSVPWHTHPWSAPLARVR